jgi:hypothetical protein
MTLTTHAVVGAAIATLFPQHPVIVFCAAFASHFVIDAIPHADYPITSPSVNPLVGAAMRYDRRLFRDTVVIAGDGILGLILSLWLFSPQASIWLIMFGAFAGILPDPLQFLYAHFRHEPLVTLQRFHQWIHTDHRMKDTPVLGVFSQILFIVLVVVFTKWRIGM